ncbi:MAG: Lrp/AsnC ligand binding domain-containing protein [Dehalococcoidia bacterium]
MPIRAYLLIEAEAGRGNQILAEVRKLPETVQADRVTGPYDVICVLESDDLDKVGDLVRQTVHNIEGVTRTMSCLRFTG